MTDKTAVDELAAELEPAAPAPVVEAPVAPAPVVEAPAPVVPAPAPSKPISAEQARINESRKALEHPLAPGTKFFESPEGYIIVGDASKDQVWCRHANNGKGMNINPRR